MSIEVRVMKDMPVGSGASSAPTTIDNVGAIRSSLVGAVDTSLTSLTWPSLLASYYLLLATCYVFPTVYYLLPTHVLPIPYS